eukprot:4400942-Amphidinium_carterae.1
MKINVSVEPAPGRTYEGYSLRYVADIAPTAGELSPSSDCSASAVWNTADGGLSATLSYSNLELLCPMNATLLDDHNISRQGVLGIYLILKSEDASQEEGIASQWIQPLEAIFDQRLKVMQPIGAWPRIWLPHMPPVHPGALESYLAFYETESFSTIKDPLVYHDGNNAWIIHALATETPPITVKWVLLARTETLEGESNLSAAIVHNLTDSVVEFTHRPGMVEFRVQVQTCHPCFLHVWSEIDLSNSESGERRLFQQQHYSYDIKDISIFDAEEGESEEDASPIFLDLKAEIGLLAVGGSAFVLGGVMHCFTQGTMQQLKDHKKMIFLELIDVIMDIGAFILAKEAGDLELQNGAWVQSALLYSTVASTVLFVMGLVSTFTCKPQMDRYWGFLSSIHIAGEDIFQTLLYLIVAISHAQEGLGDWSIYVCVVQAASFNDNEPWEVVHCALFGRAQ